MFLLIRERRRLRIPTLGLHCHRITWLIGWRWRCLGFNGGLRDGGLLGLFGLLGGAAFFLVLLLLLLIITILCSGRAPSVTRSLRRLVVHLLFGCSRLFVLSLSGFPASMVPPLIIVSLAAGITATLVEIAAVLVGIILLALSIIL